MGIDVVGVVAQPTNEILIVISISSFILSQPYKSEVAADHIFELSKDVSNVDDY